MAMQTLACRECDGQHDRIEVGYGCYQKHEHRWRETLVLRCRVCGGKRVPLEELEEGEVNG